MKDALRFFRQIRRTPECLASLQATPPEDLLTALTRMGAESGCTFTVDEL
jgi:hypothetical protein